MGVYAVAWSITREISVEDETALESQCILHTMLGPLSKKEAAEAVRDSFSETEEAQQGWILTGPPSVLSIENEVVESWLPYIDPVAVNDADKPNYLKPVPDSPQAPEE